MAIGAANLTVEYRRNPIGLDVAKPRFSWRLQGDGRAIRQQAYRIQVSQDSGFAADLDWDTGRVESDESVLIEYEGAPLKPQTRYFVRVMVWDRRGQASEWETGTWETGMMAPERWSASWISAGRPLSEWVDEPAHYLRRAFDVQGTVAQARLYATALGLYILRLNGERVGDLEMAPGWTSYAKRLQYQTYDVTNLLQPGPNVLGIMLGDGWYKGSIGWQDRRHLYGEQRAALLELHIEYADGRRETIVSDETWSATREGPLLMSGIYQGETYDARLEMPGWDRQGFDDAGWQKAETPDFSKDALIAQENEGTRVMAELAPIAVFKTPKGEQVLDFGQNMVGRVRFRVRGAAPGRRIVLDHAEVLDRDGNVYTANLRSAQQRITYICRGGEEETFEPHFTFQGFRYVRLTGYPGDPDPSLFVGRVMYTGMEPTGTFTCSHPLLNKLQENIVWGQRGNFLDIPTDCPQRDERLGWTGDAQVFIRTASFNMHTALFFAKWLRDLRTDQTEEGGVPHVVPNVLGPNAHSSAAWGDAAVICPWTIYTVYGDRRILEEQYPSMKAWVEYIRKQGDNEYLWNTGAHFGDWLGLDAKENSYKGATPDDLIATAFYAHSASLLAKAAKVLGYEEDCRTYSDLSAAIAEHFNREFVTANGRIAAPTQTAHVLALMFGLVNGDAERRTAETLARLIEEQNCHLTTGFVGTPYLCHVLSRRGYNDLAYRLVQQTDYPSWLYSVKQGATTIWEHWDGIKPDGSFWSEAMNSFNHYAYGAIGDWLYRCMAGLDSDERVPGYRKLRIAPKPGPGVTFAEARFRSMYGECMSGWKRSGDRMRIEASVPPNASATVILPRARVGTVLLDGAVLTVIDGIQSVEQSGEDVIVEVESGRYVFEYDLTS
jgi:alpha-L-rhamnosidase